MAIFKHLNAYAPFLQDFCMFLSVCIIILLCFTADCLDSLSCICSCMLLIYTSGSVIGSIMRSYLGLSKEQNWAIEKSSSLLQVFQCLHWVVSSQIWIWRWTQEQKASQQLLNWLLWPCSLYVIIYTLHLIHYLICSRATFLVKCYVVINLWYNNIFFPSLSLVLICSLCLSSYSVLSISYIDRVGTFWSNVLCTVFSLLFTR